MKLKTIAAAAALVLGSSAFAAPASASVYYCWAMNIPGDGTKEVLLSRPFSRDDSWQDMGSRENENNWRAWLSNNGWKVNDSWSCVGPYQSFDEANNERAAAIRNYDFNGWKIFYTDYGG